MWHYYFWDSATMKCSKASVIYHDDRKNKAAVSTPQSSWVLVFGFFVHQLFIRYEMTSCFSVLCRLFGEIKRFCETFTLSTAITMWALSVTAKEKTWGRMSPTVNPSSVWPASPLKADSSGTWETVVSSFSLNMAEHTFWLSSSVFGMEHRQVEGWWSPAPAHLALSIQTI